jgi:peptidoglycan/LPS O-acetylase OafA/YrhL
MQQRLVFHSFNALRFFACFRVFLQHFPKPEGNQFLNILFLKGGGMGVNFFFVLSGFLITYLLAHEYNNTGKINAKNYFLRRSLRIWPLYFLGVLIAYGNNFMEDHQPGETSGTYDPNPLFSFTFLENYHIIALDKAPNGSPLATLWSICVEEHFYLLWLLIFLCLPVRHFIKTACCLWIIGIAYRLWFYWQFPGKLYYDIDVISKLDYFCAGGIAGFMIATRTEATNRFVQRLPVVIRYGWTIMAILFFFTWQFYARGRVNSLYMPIISATLFAGLLLLVATSATFVHFSEKNIFSKLGTISYGMYVFHTVVIVVLLATFRKAGIHLWDGGNYFLFIIAAFLLTVLISQLSWHYFESYFLRLKKKYAK